MDSALIDNGRTRTYPMSTMVKKYRGFLCFIKSSLLEKDPKDTHLALAFVVIEYFDNEVHEEVRYVVHNPITLHLN